MLLRGLRVAVSTLALTCLPVSALARGGGGGHCAHGAHHAGVHGSGWPGSGGPHSAKKPSHPSTVPLSARPFPWVPAPFAPGARQFMQCSGQDIAAGESPERVRRACGEPAATSTSVRQTPNGKQLVEIWSYARPNRVTRNLRFENGVLSSIDTRHQPNR
ncbi:MAG TPA: DUF2845 domain-containing protein, partial [Polyangiaceae bacterium]|nr:DUF2845 domain-containing protein [Polyangiaceae bacterium]